MLHYIFRAQTCMSLYYFNRKIWCQKIKESVGQILGLPGGSDGDESTSNLGDLGSIPGLGRSPGEGNGYPLQYSGLENLMDRGVCGLESMGLRRIGHDWATFTSLRFRAGCRMKTVGGDEIMPFAWMCLETVILSEVSQTEKDKYDIAYLWNLKSGANELIHKTESPR